MGGPLVLLEQHRLQRWRGADTDHYDRACAVREWVGAIPLGDGAALVLGDEPAMTTAVVRADGIVLVRWHAANDGSSVELAISALADAAAIEAEDTGITLGWRGLTSSFRFRRARRRATQL